MALNGLTQEFFEKWGFDSPEAIRMERECENLPLLITTIYEIVSVSVIKQFRVQAQMFDSRNFTHYAIVEGPSVKTMVLGLIGMARAMNNEMEESR